MNKLGYTQLIDKKFEMDKKAKIHEFQQGRHDHSLFNTIFSGLLSLLLNYSSTEGFKEFFDALLLHRIFWE